MPSDKEQKKSPEEEAEEKKYSCLLYTSDAADE